MHLSYVCEICKAIRSTGHTNTDTITQYTHTHKCRQTSMQTCRESHTTQMHDSVVGVSRCRLRDSTRRSGGETTAASHSKDSRDDEATEETFGVFCMSRS